MATARPLSPGGHGLRVIAVSLVSLHVSQATPAWLVRQLGSVEHWADLHNVLGRDVMQRVNVAWPEDQGSSPG